MKKFYITLLVIFICNGIFAQNADRIFIKHFEAEDTFPSHVPIYARVSASDSFSFVDTTYAEDVQVQLIDGPGTFSGTTVKTFVEGVASFSSLIINEEGTYRAVFTSGSLKPDTTAPFVIKDMLSFLSPGDTARYSEIVGDNEEEIIMSMPFAIYVIATTELNSFIVDSTENSQVSLKVVDEATTLIGNTTINFNKGVALFNDITVNETGMLGLFTQHDNLISDTIWIEVKFMDSKPSGMCNTSTVGERNNLGLYGGSSQDLTFLNSNNRLFAGVNSPATLFYSDDSAKTWKRAFPNDSLEYECGSRGWGGGVVRVLTNNKGWVGVQTRQQGGTLTSSAISYSNGDSGTFTTGMDNYLMGQLGKQTMSLTSIALTDHYMYAALGEYITRFNDTSSFDENLVVADISDILGSTSQLVITGLAAANNEEGLPIYFTFNSSGYDYFGNHGDLYKYDESGYKKITTPEGLGLVVVYTHPHDITGDTIFICGKDTVSNDIGYYRSFDGGSNWTDITPSISSNYILFDVDYSPEWIADMPQSNGVRLGVPGSAISDDLGDTWTTFELVNNGNATHPQNKDLVFGNMGKGVVKSNEGFTGSFSLTENYGLEAVTINKIGRSSGKSIFYLATSAGLAYTTQYLNDTIENYAKWNEPYGAFPLEGVGDDSGLISVAVNPSDSNNVVVGYSNGFSVTTTGPTGFSNINPAEWWTYMKNNERVNDIAFIDSSTVIAVTGTGEHEASTGVIYGNIWKSTDKGLNWDNITPENFKQGNCVVAGNANDATSIYVGTGAFGGGTQTDGELWRSDNMGENWTKVNDGPNSINGPMTKLPIWDMAVDPRNNDTIYIASGLNLDHAFVRSIDGGVIYDYTNITGEGAFTSVMINQEEPDLVYAAIRREIYELDNATDSISLIFRGLPGEMVPDLAFGSILAGTTTGFFKITEQAEEEEENNTGENTTPSEADNSLDELNVYPIPFNNKINIDWNRSNGEPFKIRIVDALGKILFDLPIEDNSNKSIIIDSSHLTRGYYIVQVFYPNKILNTKIVK